VSDESIPELRAGNHEYRHLPEPVRLEDTIAEHEVRPVPDPEGGINPEQAFMLRYAGG
jgi:hypothetical protein